MYHGSCIHKFIIEHYGCMTLPACTHCHAPWEVCLCRATFALTTSKTWTHDADLTQTRWYVLQMGSQLVPASNLQTNQEHTTNKSRNKRKNERTDLKQTGKQTHEHTNDRRLKNTRACSQTNEYTLT